MAVTLLAILVTLALLHVVPRLAGWPGDAPFARWVRLLDDASGVARVLATLLLPVLICLAVEALLSLLPLGHLLQLVWSVLVLLYACGPRAFEADLEAILAAPDATARGAATQRLADAGASVPWHAHELGRAIAMAALRRRFGVIFWFVLLGPAGALLYRLAQALGRDSTWSLDADAERSARHTANALDWLPAQLLVFTLALVGHWDAVIGAWKTWRRQAQPTSWYTQPPDFLGEAACADIAVEIEDTDPYAERRAEPQVELVRMRSALLRALLTWLCVLAVIVLGGWLA